MTNIITHGRYDRENPPKERCFSVIEQISCQLASLDAIHRHHGVAK